jgi:hypothetical protein
MFTPSKGPAVVALRSCLVPLLLSGLVPAVLATPLITVEESDDRRDVGAEPNTFLERGGMPFEGAFRATNDGGARSRRRARCPAPTVVRPQVMRST